MPQFEKSVRRAQKKRWSPALIALPASLISAQLFAADVLIPQIIDTPDPASRGGNITYSITAQNAAGDAADDVVLNFPLPATTEFVNANNPSCLHNGATPGEVNCALGTLAANSQQDVDIVIRTNASTGSTIAISANIATSSSDSNNSNNSVNQNTTINDGADLALSLNASPSSVIAGGDIQYSATIANLGPNTSNGIRAIFDLSVDVTFVAGSVSGSGWNCSLSGQQLSCNYSGSLSNGASSNLGFRTQVTGSQLGNLISLGRVESDTGDPELSNNNSSADTTVTAGTDVAVTILRPQASAVGGEALNFTLRPRNLGPLDANNVEVTYEVDSGFSIASTPTGSGWSCAINSPTTASCTRSAYVVGASDDITVPVIAASPSTLSSYEHRTSISTTSAEATERLANNSHQTNISVTPDGLDLSLTKTKSAASNGGSSNPVAIGELMYSFITVRNEGPRTANSGTVTVNDQLAANESYVGFTGSNWSCVSGSPVICTYNSNLSANSNSSTLTIRTRANAAGTLSNNATVNYSGIPGDFNSSNNSSSASVTASNLSVNLNVVKSTSTGSPTGGDNTLDQNEESVYYRIEIRNSSTTPATGIVMTDYVPAFYSIGGYTSGVSIHSAPANYNCTTGSLVRCTQNSGSLSQGAVDTIVIKMDRPIRDGNFTNTADAFSADFGDSDRSDNSGSSSLNIAAAVDIELSNKVVSPSSTPAGANAVYTISVRNRGASTANNVELTDTFVLPAGDPGFTFIASTGASCTGLTAGNSYTAADNPTLLCDLGNMGAGATRAITLTIRPNYLAGQSGSRVFQNSTSVSTDTFEEASNQSNNSFGPVDLTITKDQVDLLIDVVDNKDGFFWDASNNGDNANNDVVYDVNYKNRGPSYATGVYYEYDITPKDGKSVQFMCDETNAGDSCGSNADTCTVQSGSNPIVGPATLTLRCLANTVAGKTDEMDVDATVGGHRYLTFRYLSKPDSGGDTHRHEARINANEAETAVSNNSEDEPTSLRAHTDLVVVEKRADISEADLEQPFRWTISLRNDGPLDSDDTVVSDTLPADMELDGSARWSINGGSSGDCTISGQDLRCELGTLANTQTATVTVPVKVMAFSSAQMQNCAAATTAGTDPDASNNSNICGTIDINNRIWNPPKNVPTLGPWGIALMMSGLLLIARRRAFSA
ncbi:hypothetical protein [uncultured Pseudoteredinibacter sp.]|uniref:hypothetical protein n=1 Tax=uncultured Pseudoteredinibacter sp. TaxID=1641701 RepID=UPI0026325C7A|nr:hypothetical protein [uncultured Pseudoteredinibacter sp.]